MAVVVSGVSANMSGHIQSQLTRSLERILEDANLSGELKLSGRKLKDFPKTGKYNLDDTVTADLSKNRFGEVPDEVTAFMFLEKLLLYHNSIRNVPDSISGLQSLSYLDLSRNQLSEVPRELCLLPLQVLLLSNNRLTCLPKELGRMAQLAELDASCNLLAQLPISLGELPQLRALNLRDNRLGLLPLQITYLQLELLDVSCNCISSLPLELRHMTQLVTLNLEHNPLVSPPATVCVRGRIHIFKYLEGQAGRDCARRDEARRPLKGVSATLPPNTSSSSASSQPALCPPAVEGLRHRARYNVDSGYSTSDGGDKRWSSDAINCVDEGGGQLGSGRSTPSTPSTISPGPAHLSRAQSLSSDTPPSTPTASCRISPDSANVPNGDDKNRSLSHQQTYKQYKEALRQQRQQDVYRPRGEQISPPSANPPSLPHSHSTPHSPVANGYHRTSPSLTSSPRRFPPTSSPNSTTNGTHSTEESNKRPVQKVVPSRSTNNKNYNTGIPASNSNNTLLSPTNNGNNGLFDYAMTMPARLDGYIKPVSPVKESAYMTHNSVPGALKSNSLGRNIGDPSSLMNGDAARLLTTSVGFVSGSGLPSRINWNKEGPPDKLSFTMKREFDRAKEESELIQQLRSIIETRLKMSLPADLAPALSDGVVLCHLANNVRPRAVASVHVPSPGQPKLTMARCRRNVDNFLEACRRMGVEEKLMCCAADILEGKGAVQVAITVTELHRRQTSQNTHSQPNN